MSFQDLVKYVTQQFVQYIETPKEQRVQKKAEKKSQHMSWETRLFGTIPTAIRMWLKRD